jgi:hypothetical protein
MEIELNESKSKKREDKSDFEKLHSRFFVSRKICPRLRAQKLHSRLLELTEESGRTSMRTELGS